MNTLDSFTKTIINDMVLSLYKEEHKQRFINCLYELNFSLQLTYYNNDVFRKVKQMRDVRNFDNCRVTWIHPKSVGFMVPFNVNPKKHIPNFKYDYSDPTDTNIQFHPAINSRCVYLCWQHSLDTHIVELFPFPQIPETETKITEKPKCYSYAWYKKREKLTSQ